MRTAWTRNASVVALAVAVAACGEKKPAEPQGPPPAPESGRSAVAAPDRERLVAAYDKGLDYLLTQQKDGKWSVQDQADPGFTSLALTAFYERPGGLRESDRKVVDAGLDFVLKSLIWSIKKGKKSSLLTLSFFMYSNMSRTAPRRP